MIANTAGLQLRNTLRLVLAVMVAVVASMTLHHGAMAQGSDLDGHAVASMSQHGPDACVADCTPADHSMPVCCAMGLCLSGMPVDFADILTKASDLSIFAQLAPAGPFKMLNRIDRPPKIFPKA